MELKELLKINVEELRKVEKKEIIEIISQIETFDSSKLDLDSQTEAELLNKILRDIENCLRDIIRNWENIKAGWLVPQTPKDVCRYYSATSVIRKLIYGLGE